MITVQLLNDMEYDLSKQKYGVGMVNLDFIRDVRKLMAENIELYTSLDKIKSAVAESVKLLNEVLNDTTAENK